MKRFFCLVIALCLMMLPAGCKNEGDNLNVYMPDGATAISMSYMMANQTQILDYKINYTVVPPSTISGYLDGSADFVVMPINGAVASYIQSQNQSNYKLLSVITHGNLFLLGNPDADTNLTGKTVGVIGGLGNIPYRVIKFILTARGYDVDGGEVTITPFSAPYDARDALLNGNVDCVVLAQPDVTNYLNTTFLGTQIQILSNLQQEWNEIEGWTDYDGYAQACLMVKNDVDSDLIEQFIDLCKQNQDWAKQNHEQAIQAIKDNYIAGGTSTIGSLTAGSEATQIQDCNIRFKTDNLNNYVTACLDRLGITAPNQGFYYQ